MRRDSKRRKTDLPKGFRRWHQRRKILKLRWGGKALWKDWDPKTLWAIHVTNARIVCLNGGLRDPQAHDLLYEVLAHEILHDAGFTEAHHAQMRRLERRLGQAIHDLLLTRALPSCDCPEGAEVGV